MDSCPPGRADRLGRRGRGRGRRHTGPHRRAAWTLIVLAAYPVGVWTTAVQPANRAAAALLAVGCVGLTWAALSADLVSRVDANPAFPGFIALNAVVQAAGFLMVAAQVIALVRYPDGRRVYAVEDWLLRGMLLLAPLLPVVLLLTRPQVVPAWVVQYAGPMGCSCRRRSRARGTSPQWAGSGRRPTWCRLS